MSFRLTWLPDVLKDAGLKVAMVDGWKDRGRGDAGETVGVICHHTGGPQAGNMPSLKTLINGRSDLPGPLAQLGLGRDGTYYVIAAGKCNHAGAGSWRGIATGNTSFIGIEGENTGLAGDEWPGVQMDAYQRGVAAILKHIGRGAEFCCGHKEYAPGRKVDPLFDMNVFRAQVTAFLNGTTPPPPPIPAAEPVVAPGQTASRPTLRRGAKGDLVVQIQKKLGIAPDGDFGPGTEAAMRAFQAAKGLVPDGIVGPKTWVALDAG